MRWHCFDYENSIETIAIYLLQLTYFNVRSVHGQINIHIGMFIVQYGVLLASQHFQWKNVCVHNNIH